MAEHIYCGSGKDKEFQDGGHLLTITLNLDELEKNFSAYGFTTNTGKRTIKVKVSKRREIGQYGETHTVEIETWKPNTTGPKSTQNASNGKGYQVQAKSPSKPLSVTANESLDDFEDEVPF